MRKNNSVDDLNTGKFQFINNENNRQNNFTNYAKYIKEKRKNNIIYRHINNQTVNLIENTKQNDSNNKYQFQNTLN